jgi:hypothetical protein
MCMGFICHHFLAVVVQTWVWSKDAMFGFSVPHGEKLCAIIRVNDYFSFYPFLRFKLALTGYIYCDPLIMLSLCT